MTPTVTKCPLYRPYAGTLGFDESVPHGPDVPGQLPPLFPSVDLRGAITQRPERQFTSGLVCAKALFLVFHGHQSACELSLWSLSYSRSTVPRDSFSPGDSFSHELAMTQRTARASNHHIDILWTLFVANRETLPRAVISAKPLPRAVIFLQNRFRWCSCLIFRLGTAS